MGSLKMNTALEYSTRVVQKGDRRCKKSTLNDLAYLTPLRIPLMNPVLVSFLGKKTRASQHNPRHSDRQESFPGDGNHEVHKITHLAESERFGLYG